MGELEKKMVRQGKTQKESDKEQAVQQISKLVSQPTISKIIPKQAPQPLGKKLAKTASDIDIAAIDQNIDILKTSTDQQEIKEALDYLNNNSQYVYTKQCLVDALPDLISKYSIMHDNSDGTTAPAWTSDEISRNNLSSSLNLLGISVLGYLNKCLELGMYAPISPKGLVYIVETCAPFVDSYTYSRDNEIYQDSVRALHQILNPNLVSDSPDSDPKNLSSVSILPQNLRDSLFTYLSNNIGNGIETRELLVDLCTYFEGQNNVPTLIQKYSSFMVSDSEKNFFDMELFAKILAYGPDNLSSGDYGKLIEHLALNLPQGTDANSMELIMSVQAPITDIMALGRDIINSGDMKNAVSKIKQEYDTMADGNQKTALGAIISNCVFMKPELAADPSLSAIVGLDSATITAMNSQYQGQGTTGYDLVYAFGIHLSNFLKIYEIAQKHKGEPIAKTLFEQNNITLFSNYPMDVIEHLYYDRNKTSEKPIMFMAFTKRPGLLNNFGDVFYTFDYTKFDIRVIEPGTDDNMVSLMQGTSTRLGKKFRYLIVNGHGDPSGIMLKTAAGGNSPTELDMEDVELLKQIKPLFVDNPDVVLFACSTAKGNNG
ncbi:MAG: hypothetical protein NTY68_04070, partial [Candidatus Micrarchaeota archaeon]|nr:hypothetical protein [Candidatus Micrarchaeota archaeon]